MAKKSKSKYKPKFPKTQTNLQRAISKYWLLFLVPTFVAFIIGFIYPFLQGIYLSLCTFTTTSDAKFVGFSNYVKVFQDATFVHAFWYTGLYAIVSLVIINLAAFLIAYGLTSKIKGTGIFRTAFFMPNLIGGIVLGYIWSMIFNGILSQYNTSILMETKYGFWGLIILMCWQQIGYMMIIYIAGLQSIDTAYLEAAQIDGATALQTLFKVKIPNVMSSITICLFLTLTNGFKLFDQNLALTGGEPAHKSEMLALNIYQTFYARSGAQWKGYGQAKAVVFCILVICISLLQLRITKSKEVQA